MLACSKLVAPLIFNNIPKYSKDANFKTNEKKLSRIIAKITKDFQESKSHEVVEIPMTNLELDHKVQAFVSKL